MKRIAKKTQSVQYIFEKPATSYVAIYLKVRLSICGVHVGGQNG